MRNRPTLVPYSTGGVPELPGHWVTLKQIRVFSQGLTVWHVAYLVPGQRHRGRGEWRASTRRGRLPPRSGAPPPPAAAAPRTHRPPPPHCCSETSVHHPYPRPQPYQPPGGGRETREGRAARPRTFRATSGTPWVRRGRGGQGGASGGGGARAPRGRSGGRSSRGMSARRRPLSPRLVSRLRTVSRGSRPGF